MVLHNYTEFLAVCEIIGVKSIVTLPENQFKMALCGEWGFLETLNLVWWLGHYYMWKYFQVVEKERQVAVSKDYHFSDCEEKDDISRVEQHQGKTLLHYFFRLREKVSRY